MDEEIRKIIKVAGNLHRYQILITILCFIFWCFAALFTNTLGFLEVSPSISYYDQAKNKTLVASKDYKKCDWDESSYIRVDESKISWVIDLEIECEKSKISLFGTFRALGAMSGSFVSSYIANFLGTRLTLIIIDVFFCLLVLLTFFIKNYVYCAITILLCACSCNIILYSVMVLFGEIINKDKKPILNVFINSGLGIGGVFFVLFFLGYKNWKYVFITDICILLANGVLVSIFFIQTPSSYLKNKDMKGFMESVRYIAKFNKRSQIFEDAMKKPEFIEILEKLKGDTNDNSANKIKDNNDVKDDSQNNKNNNLYSTENENIEKDKKEIVDKNNDNNKNIGLNNKENTSHKSLNELHLTHENDHEVPLHPKTEIHHQIIIPVSILDLVKYKSVRKTFLLFCLFWLVAGMLYAGLVIGTKNLPGNIYTNNLILFSAESVGYYVSGVTMNIKKIGRKGALMIFTFGFSLMCYLMVIFFKHKTVYVVLYIITRFFNMSAFVIYYTFCLESYPTSAKALAYGLNGGCNSIGGIIISFVIEYVASRWLYLIYACLGTVCAILMIFLKDTIGVQQPTNIVEMEEDKLKHIPVANV